MILGGRACDLGDGLAARRLRQESGFGAGFDAY